MSECVVGLVSALSVLLPGMSCVCVCESVCGCVILCMSHEICLSVCLGWCQHCRCYYLVCRVCGC